ncbi:SGNH hydrolase-type esterase domain-containing protein [Thelonectria olida]|uniref:SGNH hydrolase-type esterase domain-containing protein n=1 Tax=Thelonectria olida TaxID=1576542 RepID=A0A9P9ASU8_9HYPO|nr:SGNH hydrolase-type esterase domain-containing protein [Thelonectria olida]
MQSSMKQFWRLAALSLTLTTSAAASSDESIDDSKILVGGNVDLRLMPLGASITRGKGSEDGNGYRKYLRDLLVADGNDVDMVGTQKSGSMNDNEHEGWDGLRIDQVYEKAQKSVPERLPNLITINAGTNDCAQDYDIDGAADRMLEMLEFLWDASPKASIILSTLLVNGDSDIEERVLEVNKQLTTLGKNMTAKSKKLILVDMHSSDGPQEDDLVDGTHPNSDGYEKMAKIWFEGIEEAASRGWLESPQVLSTASSSTSSATSTPGGSNATKSDTVASETANVGGEKGSNGDFIQSTTQSASSSQETQDGSRASRAGGYPTIALILALSTLVLFT